MKKLVELWKQEAERSLEGWEFSYLDDSGRWEMEPLPWDYLEIVRQYLKETDRLLDMGTGGGEILLTLAHPYNKTSTTEGYLPNYQLCKKKLEPLGITVKFVNEDDHLPYPDGHFDMIINRHEAFRLDEVNRTLKHGGIFITQQVGCENSRALSKRLLKKELEVDFRNQLSYQLKQARKIGFEVLSSDEFYATLKFFDTGAIAYYASVIEWEFPNFSVDNCLDALMEVHHEIEGKGFVSSIEHRYMMVLGKS
ncbi:SAM-dependent methyltransferase [Tetragenococcus osmophilus]|uniref:Methyltransferase n=1 Tax=Tetragenococcus osmophilus TaxID=526944 RepID=A0AA38CYH4_9ENTE|nr:class I SAM-dependent methyltransferase [Tetragenococcus osmophilus]AYW47841.1 SAM-dependent methyltransferase [Tetragenococcus osmophilus]GMA53538.1 methyltransferase [Alicyclobacillus contaminans]GMA72519.1 methyltransferase [Tetragenococcus osmophilus]